MSSPIYEQLSAERLMGVPEGTVQMPAVPAGAVSYAGVVDRVPPAGVDDHLAENTDNGLRPDDELLEQPPQDPWWRP